MFMCLVFIGLFHQIVSDSTSHIHYFDRVKSTQPLDEISLSSAMPVCVRARC